MKKNYLNLTKLRKTDIFVIMKWRNEQMKILRQKKKLFYITNTQQILAQNTGSE